MSKYEIIAEYFTGDSFHTEDTETTLPPVWENLEKAKEALAILDTHHRFYLEEDKRHYDSTVYLSPEEIEKFKASPYYDSKYPEFGVKVPLDDGTLMDIHIPYHGYFEHLYGFRIEVIEGNDDMSRRY